MKLSFLFLLVLSSFSFITAIDLIEKLLKRQKYEVKLFQSNKLQQKVSTCLPPQYPIYCHCYTYDTLTCFNFTNLSDIKFNQVSDGNTFQNIQLTPRNKLQLNKNLNLSGLKADLTKQTILTLNNFDSFIFLTNPINDFIFNNSNNNNINHNGNLILELRDSLLDFKLNDENLEDLIIRCDPKLFDEEIVKSYKPLFSSFSEVVLHESVKFQNSEICPLVFLNANITRLSVSSLNDANHRLVFKQITNSSRITFNAVIKRFEIDNSSLDILDTHLLNSDLFYNLNELIITDSTIVKFDDNLFKMLSSIEIIMLQLRNFNQFFKENNNTKWLNSISVSSDKRQVLVAFIDNYQQYYYPDEDFCLFYEYPHNKSVFTYIQTKKNLNCSCTLVWLMKNWRQYGDSNLLLSDSVYDCLIDNTYFNELFMGCKFDERIQSCSGVKPTAEPIKGDKNLGLKIGLPVGLISLLVIVIVAGAVWYKFVRRRQPVINVDEEDDNSFTESEVEQEPNDGGEYDANENTEPANTNTQTTVNLFDKYNSLFLTSDYDYGRCKLIKHTINTANEKPIKVFDKTRLKLSDSQKLNVQKQLNEMLLRNIITQTTNNEWCLPVIAWEDQSLVAHTQQQLAYKADNELGNFNISIFKSFFLDFRDLNAILKRDTITASELKKDINRKINVLKQANYFTRLNLSFGSMQIELDSSSKHKTTFQSPLNDTIFYNFEVIPYGLANLKYTFENLVDLMLNDCLYKSCVVYHDSIIVFSKTLEEHYNHLEKVFIKLKENNLKLNKLNSSFIKRSIEFYNYLIRSDGNVSIVDTVLVDFDEKILPNEKTVRLIKSFPKPTTVKLLTQFMQILTPYKQYLQSHKSIIKDFEFIVQTMNTTATTKKITIDESKYYSLKSALLSLLKSNLPYMYENLVLYSTSTANVFSCVLIQKHSDETEYPISFLRKYRKDSIRSDTTTILNQKAYMITENKIMSILWAIEQFMPTLYERKFLITMNSFNQSFQFDNGLKLLDNDYFKLYVYKLQSLNFEVIIKPPNQLNEILNQVRTEDLAN